MAIDATESERHLAYLIGGYRRLIFIHSLSWETMP
jgi:hypothetical protein